LDEQPVLSLVRWGGLRFRVLWASPVWRTQGNWVWRLESVGKYIMIFVMERSGNLQLGMNEWITVSVKMVCGYQT
jgi:hypothetical protein